MTRQTEVVQSRVRKTARGHPGLGCWVPNGVSEENMRRKWRGRCGSSETWVIDRKTRQISNCVERMGIRFLTVGEESYKYGKGKKQNTHPNESWVMLSEKVV